MCGETILAVAIKCKHCGSALTREAAQKTETLGVVALCLPVAAAVLEYYWIGFMPLLYDPAIKLTGVAALTVVVTAILIAVEASQVGAGGVHDLTKSGKRADGPFQWFLWAVVLWVIGFPMWMYERSKYGLQSRWVVAVSVVLIFAATTAVMSIAIEAAKEEALRAIDDAMRGLDGY